MPKLHDQITLSYTIWCRDCCTVQTVSGPLRYATRELKVHGWTKVGGVWRCGMCIWKRRQKKKVIGAVMGAVLTSKTKGKERKVGHAFAPQCKAIRRITRKKT